MANPEQLDILDQGVHAWNRWRKEEHTRKDVSIDLSGADLSRRDLRGAYFSFADLTGVKFVCSDLRDAQFTTAKLERADFSGANLEETSFWGAELINAELQGANLVGAFFVGANLAGSSVADVTWDRRAMRQRFLGIRGAEACQGNALFRRDAIDQDFLDTLERNWTRTRGRKMLFRAWGYLDYGRSITRVAGFTAAWMLFFGFAYRIPGAIDYSRSAGTGFSSFYFSIVTFTTLGYGDITPKNVLGEILTCIEVILGYFTLGLFLAVLAEKVARRS